MSRPLRIQFAGAHYHLMNRGDHFEPIFADDQDRQMFLHLVGETCRSAGWAVHGFALMPNHYHLLVETQRATLVAGMQSLNSTYTSGYNRRHHLRGHLFQGRYKAIVVETKTPGYFLTASDYIQLNPVRKRLVTTFEAWVNDPWNSVGWLAGLRSKRPPWMAWERVYGELGLTGWHLRAQKHYRAHLRQWWDQRTHEPQAWHTLRRGWCLGSETFHEEMKTLEQEPYAMGRNPDRWNGPAVDELEEDRAGGLLREAARHLGYQRVEEIHGRERYLVARWVRLQTRVSVGWLAHQLGVQTRGGLSHGITRIAQTLLHDRHLTAQWKQLEAG